MFSQDIAHAGPPVAEGIVEFETPKKWDLSLFEFVCRTQGLPEDCRLRKDLEKHALEGVRLELAVPKEFPMSPPSVRILHPQLSGGHVFPGGAICFEPLTPAGWSSTISLPSLAVMVAAHLANDSTRPVTVQSVGADRKTIPQYTREAAEKELAQIIRAHNDGTKWSVSREKLRS
jgi:ubiquitin-conjugating enzyme E2 Q